MLEQKSYLILNSVHLQDFTLICMYLTPGLNELISIRIPSLLNYNWL